MTDLVEFKEPTQSMVMPIASPKEILAYQDIVHKLIQDGLKLGVDYGVIPGTGDKPSLLKPGSERIFLAFGAAPHFEILQSEIDHNRESPFQKKKKIWNNKFKGDRSFTEAIESGVSLGLYRYVVKCKIIRSVDNRFLGDGIGSCSSLESKYVDRPRDLENTILKMAKKRAQIDACLTTFALSNRFTQDVEDMQDDKKASGFDPENIDHAAALEKALEKKGIDNEKWAAVAVKMKGKPFSALDAVLAEKH